MHKEQNESFQFEIGSKIKKIYIVSKYSNFQLANFFSKYFLFMFFDAQSRNCF